MKTYRVDPRRLDYPIVVERVSAWYARQYKVPIPVVTLSYRPRTAYNHAATAGTCYPGIGSQPAQIRIRAGTDPEDFYAVLCHELCHDIDVRVSRQRDDTASASATNYPQIRPRASSRRTLLTRRTRRTAWHDKGFYLRLYRMLLRASRDLDIQFSETAYHRYLEREVEYKPRGARAGARAAGARMRLP